MGAVKEEFMVKEYSRSSCYFCGESGDDAEMTVLGQISGKIVRCHPDCIEGDFRRGEE